MSRPGGPLKSGCHRDSTRLRWVDCYARLNSLRPTLQPEATLPFSSRMRGEIPFVVGLVAVLAAFLSEHALLDAGRIPGLIGALAIVVVIVLVSTRVAH